MKEEVIMRDKIAKNRELYMIQLKVYALRCRSHKLSKKGTFKWLIIDLKINLCVPKVKMNLMFNLYFFYNRHE